MDKNFEYRAGTLDVTNPQLMKIGGLAIATESRSELLAGEFYEVISKRAMEGLIENNDIQLIVNHMPERGTLARSKYGKGSLNLNVSERGLEFETVCPDSAFGKEIYEGVSRADYDAVSFGFRVLDDSWSKNSDGTYLRTINSFDTVVEISLLSQAPAYSATECATRSLNAFKETEKRAEEDAEQKRIEEEKKKADEAKAKADAEKAEQEKKEKELKEYYENLKKSLD